MPLALRRYASIMYIVMINCSGASGFHDTRAPMATRATLRTLCPVALVVAALLDDDDDDDDDDDEDAWPCWLIMMIDA